jgi:hypothetical protein
MKMLEKSVEKNTMAAFIKKSIQVAAESVPVCF